MKFIKDYEEDGQFVNVFESDLGTFEAHIYFDADDTVSYIFASDKNNNLIWQYDAVMGMTLSFSSPFDGSKANVNTIMADLIELDEFAAQLCHQVHIIY